MPSNTRADSSYAHEHAQRVGPEPKLDWKPGDPPERWPHHFVQHSMMAEGVCGVVLDNTTMQRCCGAPQWRIHHVR